MDVNTRNRADLKAFFVKNSIPTQSNFADLIDGMLNQKDDGFVKAQNLPLSIEAADPGVADSEKKAVTIYQSFADPTPAWTLSLNPRTVPNDPKTAKLGFSISDGEGTNRLFIDRNSGHVGIGTTTPKGKLEVATGGAGAWNKFVVNTTNLWGDGNTQYVTIGEGGAAGIMFYNPHVVWYDPEKRASIRMGRSGGIATGHWWDIGVRAGNVFSIVDGQSGVTGLAISETGDIALNGKHAFRTNDPWLRLNQDKAFQNGVHTPGLFAPMSLNVGGVGGWGNPGDNNVVVAGTIGTNGFSAKAKKAGWGGGIHTFDLEAEGTIWSKNGIDTSPHDLAENYYSDMELEAGNVVCLDRKDDRIVKSERANDNLVLGVISTQPGFLLNAEHDEEPRKDGKWAYPVALSGRVPCYVTNENGPISRGDLLTSSSIRGHAMKATPIAIGGVEIYAPGTIIGKALEALDTGTGVIEVFVTLR